MEQYQQWLPIEPLPKNFYLNNLRHEKGQLEITFKDFDPIQDKQLILSFRHCLAYRVVQESGRAKSINNPTLGQFNRSVDSEFLSWFKGEGVGIYDDWILIHYAIVNLDSIVDVITNEEPSVGWMSV